ncbi:MAG TPA: hypothetical protein DEV74_10015 [Acidovorax sp.]|nr:hypothetical protein EXV95_21190 [Acidovorax sp. JMULE5]HCE92823.1 hypothetical protein [Acidovorax sp.]
MKYPGMSAAGPPQGAKAPLGGSAAHAVASVGALWLARGSPHGTARERWRCTGPPRSPATSTPFPIWQLPTNLETGAPR